MGLPAADFWRLTPYGFRRRVAGWLADQQAARDRLISLAWHVEAFRRQRMDRPLPDLADLLRPREAAPAEDAEAEFERTWRLLERAGRAQQRKEGGGRDGRPTTAGEGAGGTAAPPQAGQQAEPQGSDGQSIFDGAAQGLGRGGSGLEGADGGVRHGGGAAGGAGGADGSR